MFNLLSNPGNRDIKTEKQRKIKFEEHNIHISNFPLEIIKKNWNCFNCCWNEKNHVVFEWIIHYLQTKFRAVDIYRFLAQYKVLVIARCFHPAYILLLDKSKIINS